MIDHTCKSILSRRGFAWVACLSFCCIGGSAGQHSGGQELMPPTTSTQKMASPVADLFSADLEILSKRLGVAFVAEGQPLPATSERPVPTLSEKLSQEDAIREVADYFDYSAVRQGNVYLLTKQYTRPDDMPDVTPDECRSGLKTISKILAPFNPKFPPGTFAGSPKAKIARMLSADQLERLGKDGVPVSELTPMQHEEVWRLALYFYVQSQAEEVEKTYTELENRNPADPLFHWQTVMNVRAFGYDTRSVPLNKILFIPVSDSNRIRVSPNGAMTQRSITHVQNGIVESVPDPTDPNGLAEPIKRFLDDKGKVSHTISLSEAISHLNRRPANSVVYKVDAMYATKHVTLVGAEKLPAVVLLRALAAVYGLRVVQNEDGSFEMTRLLMIEAKQISDLGRALRSAIPKSIYRVIQARALTASQKTLGAKGGESLMNYMTTASVLNVYAMQMFRYLAEPEVKFQPEGKLALSHLGERARNLFEFAPTAPIYSQACWLADRQTPPYISDFNHITLTGGISRNADGAERFELFLSYVDPKTGEKRQGVGFGNAILPP